MKKRVLSMLMALLMVFSLMPTSVFAAGTAEDPFDIGDIFIGENAPQGTIPEHTKWVATQVPAVYSDTTECETEHEHSVAEGCYALVSAAHTIWTLQEQAGGEPTVAPSAEPSAEPSVEPTAAPSAEPTAAPSAEPTAVPSAEPTAAPSAEPPAPTLAPAAVYTVNFRLTRDGRGVGGETITISAKNGDELSTVGTVVTGTGYSSRGTASYDLPEGTYEASAKFEVNGSVYEAKTTFTVPVTGTVNLQAVRSTEITDGALENAYGIYQRKNTFDHIDVRVDGQFTYNTTTYNVYLQNVSFQVLNNRGNEFSHTFTNNSQTYEWRRTGVTVYKGATVVVTADIYDKADDTLLKRQFAVTYTDDGTINSDFVRAIAVCDGRQGLDFIIDPVEIVEAITHQVNYKWTLADGSDFTLREEPTDGTDYEPGAEHTIDTVWTPGTEVVDTTNHKVYTFRGWSEYGVTGSGDKTPIADGQTTVVLNDDTTIYGVWDVRDLEELPTKLILTKSFVDDQGNRMTGPADYQVTVTGPDGKSAIYTLKDDFVWDAAAQAYTCQVELTASGAYTVTEENCDLAGYAMTVQTQVQEDPAVAASGHKHITKGTGTGASKTVSFTVALDHEGDTPCQPIGSVDFVNSYTKQIGQSKHLYPTITLNKLRDSNAQPVAGVQFRLYSDEQLTQVVADLTTDAQGAASYAFTAAGVYYLVETAAADGYALETAVWKLEVAEVSAEEELVDGEFVTTHVYDVTVTKNEGSGFESDPNFAADDNVLTVYNTRNSGTLTVRKVFPTSNQLTVDAVKLEVVGTKDFTVDGVVYNENNPYEVLLTAADLAAGNGDGSVVWARELAGLPLDTYTLTEVSVTYTHEGSTGEITMNPDGTYPDVVLGADQITYKWNVVYAPRTVELTSANTEVTVEVSNSFTRVNPVDLLITKTDANGAALSGAVFTLTRMEDQTLVGTYTSGANGEIRVDGFLNTASYRLEETAAPANYALGSISRWQLDVVRQDSDGDGVDEVTLTATPVDGDGMLLTEQAVTSEGTTVLAMTVVNERKLGNLVISKEVDYLLDGTAIADGLVEAHNTASYSISVAFSDDQGRPLANRSFTTSVGSVTTDANGVAQITLREGESLTIQGIPYGTAYQVTEQTAGAAFTAAISGGDQRMDMPEETVTVTNTYRYTTNNPGLQARKVDYEDHSLLAGAEFALYRDADCTQLISSGVSGADGLLELEIPDEGVYYLKEVTAPQGYHLSDTVYRVEAQWKYLTHDAGEASAYTEKRLVVRMEQLGQPAPGASDTALIRYDIPNTAIKPVVITVSKTWDDGDYYARPGEITLILYRNGEVYQEVQVRPDAQGNWSYTWSGPEYTDADQWAVGEVVPDGYEPVAPVELDDLTPEISGDADAKYYTVALENCRDISNTEISVKKIWEENYSEDNDSADRNLAKPITVILYKENLVTEKTEVNRVVLDGSSKDAQGDWVHTFTTDAQGNRLTDNYRYSIDEIYVDGQQVVHDTVPGYSKEINGFVVTNTRVVKQVEIHVEKTWEVPEVWSGLPEALEVQLYRNGVLADSRMLTAETDWQTTWTELPDGRALTDEDNWSVQEVLPEGYVQMNMETAFDGEASDETTKVYEVHFTNALDCREITISVEKTWVVPEGFTAIPESVVVQLYRDGEAYGEEVKLSAVNGWKHSWSGEAYIDAFQWEVKEVDVPKGYTVTTTVESGETELFYELTNTLQYGLDSVSVSKVWLNPKDFDKQPTSVAVVLYRDGVAYASVTLSKANNWSYKWTDLPDCFQWTVDEPDVPKDYAKKVTHVGNAWIITNAHKDIPLTGDNNNPALWLGLGAAAVIGLGATLFVAKKKHKEDE